MATAHLMLRRTVAVLASAWFFPVSCTTVMGVGSAILADTDARDAANGDTMHRSIAVVAVPPPAPGQAFGHLLLANVPSYKEAHPDASFLMPAAAGRIDLEGRTTVSYKVVASAGAEQTIETQYGDGDRAAWGRYRATRREITPLASRLSSADYVLGMSAYAFAAAFIVWIVAGLLRRRMK